jgi:CheY-like chemotaxis protein/HPt (histidine-containing phosphotransfer) domain-containing protein
MGGHITVESQASVGSTFHLSLPLALGDAIPQRTARLPSRSVRIFTRRPSLADSVARHAAALGLTVLPADSEVLAADVVVVDASTRPSTLSSLLAASSEPHPKLVVIATSADVESRALRLLLPERQIVLKPVHGTALHEAFAAALGSEAETAHGHAAQASSGPIKAHVLLVEDEPVNAGVAEGYLAALGCTSATVTNGAEAVACAAAERFDIILMDLSMPGMDGFETTALIRSQQSRANVHGGEARLPIVALTAHDPARYRDKCLAADMDDILSKPYTLEDCAHMLHRWLARADSSGRHARAAHTITAAPGTSATLVGVDANAVAALRKLDAGRHPDLYSKLVELFRASSTQSLAELDAALARGDLLVAAAVCHKLASAAANVGAMAYAQRVKELERHALAEHSEAARDACNALLEAHTSLLDVLQSHCLRATA